MEPHVEAPEHFHEPLVHERFRNQHQDPICPSAQEQTMQDKTGLNRFSKPHLVRQHHTRGLTVGDLLRDVKLVRDEINSTTQESAYWRLARAVEQIKRAAPKLKSCRGIKASRKQTLLRSTQTEAVVQLGFGELLVLADVSQQTVLFDDLCDDEFPVPLSFYLVAHA